MSLKYIQLMFDYNVWANDLILTKAGEITPEQLKAKTNFPWGSLYNTLIHVMDTEYGWRNLCQYNRRTPVLDQEHQFETLTDVTTLWQKERADMQDYLDSLTEDDLDGVTSYNVPDGVRERILWHCLLHIVNHGTQHRSECAQILTDFGQSPGDIDLMLFLNQRKA